LSRRLSHKRIIIPEIELSWRKMSRSGTAAALVLSIFAVLTLAVDVQPNIRGCYQTSTSSGLTNLVASTSIGIIYFRSDGTVDPVDAPVSNVDDVTFILTSNIQQSIVVERDNIVIDGGGYILNGSGDGAGIDLSGRSNVTVRNVEIRGFEIGIRLFDTGYESHNVSVVGNIITENECGICFGDYDDRVFGGFNHSIVGNTVANNTVGVDLISVNSTVSHNNITGSDVGIFLWSTFQTVSENHIVSEKDGIVAWISQFDSIRGNNVTTYNGNGVSLNGSYYSMITQNNIITNNGDGIHLGYDSTYDWAETCSYNNITWNNINTENGEGIVLQGGMNNTMLGNNITTINGNSVHLDSFTHRAMMYSCSNNSIYENNFTAGNAYSIKLVDSTDNLIFHNNFISNTTLTNIINSENVWDNGYPSGGNYWSDYVGQDEYFGRLQDRLSNDGIGDTRYSIDDNSMDRYPLMELWPERPKFPYLVDLNNDGEITMGDIVVLASLYMSKEGDPEWNAKVDVSLPYGLVDIVDIVTVVYYFIEVYR